VLVSGDAATHARALSTEELDTCERLIDDWLADELADNPAVLAVDRGEPDERRWYVRLAGEAKPVYAVWFTLRQRTLHYETYLAPYPPRRSGEVFEMVLRRNAKLLGQSFQIGQEDAIFLAGAMAASLVDAAELDQILGTIFAEVEAVFAAIVRLAFAPEPGSSESSH
jgi:hypothetical protein